MLSGGLDKLPYGKFIPEFGGACCIFDFFFGGGWRGGPAFDRTKSMKHSVRFLYRGHAVAHRAYGFGLELRGKHVIINPDGRCKPQIKRDVNILWRDS